MTLSALYWALGFQSTLSMRRATTVFFSTQAVTTSFQSTLSMRRATETVPGTDNLVHISIHALHEESDLVLFRADL